MTREEHSTRSVNRASGLQESARSSAISLPPREVSGSLRSLTVDPKLRDQLEVRIPTSLPYEHLALAVLDRLVPAKDLERRSLREPMHYRRANRETLARMRLSLGALAAEVALAKIGPDYYRSIKRLVGAKVIPELLSARDELLKRYEGAFGKLAIQSPQVTARLARAYSSITEARPRYKRC
jgi:hypothetical protein